MKTTVISAALLALAGTATAQNPPAGTERFPKNAPVTLDMVLSRGPEVLAKPKIKVATDVEAEITASFAKSQHGPAGKLKLAVKPAAKGDKLEAEMTFGLDDLKRKFKVGFADELLIRVRSTASGKLSLELNADKGRSIQIVPLTETGWKAHAGLQLRILPRPDVQPRGGARGAGDG